MAVTINAPDDWNDHAALLNEGFSRYTLQQIVTAGETIGTTQVLGGDNAEVELQAAEDFSYPLAEGERADIQPIGPGFDYAPVVEGADAGHAWVCIDGKRVGKVALRYGKTVELSTEEEQSFWKRFFRGDK